MKVNMNNKTKLVIVTSKEDTAALTLEDLNEFLTAVSYEEQWKTLLKHAEINNKIIKIRRRKKMEQYNDHHYEEISKQFEEFCHTKGLVAKFKVAFSDMADNARKQRELDKANFDEVKRKSMEENPEFSEFVHTKGLKAKIKLVVENMKKSAKEAPQKTAVAVDNIRAQTKANIAHSQAKVQSTTIQHKKNEYSADELSREFNEFLKAKGLDSKYAVEITSENKN